MMHRKCPANARGGLAFLSLRGSNADLLFHSKYFKIVFHFKRKVQIAFLDLSVKREWRELHLCVHMAAHSHSAHEHTCTHDSIYPDAYVNMSVFACLQVYKHVCVHEACTFLCKHMSMHACGHICHACVCTHACLHLWLTEEKELKSQSVYYQIYVARQGK